jgi:multimeric flavodoxin WrbA
VRAPVLNCTLKPSPAESNTEALARVVTKALEGQGVTTELVRVADDDVRPGVSSDEGDGDQWPQLRAKVLESEILVMARCSPARCSRSCSSSSPAGPCSS